jgi:hypothetical protein
LPTVQIVTGVLAVAMAALLVTGILPAPRLPTQARRLANGQSLWLAAAAGLGIALPSFDYLAVLAVIVASGADAATQVGALATFIVVAFALVEVPLVAYLVTPDKTRAVMAAFNGWIRSRRRREVAALLGGAGAIMIAVGAAGL